MPSSTDCWGIEVGSAAIKAVRLNRDGDDVSVTDFDVIPFKKVLTTPDADAEEQIRVGLDQLIARHELTKATVVASVPGHMAFARFAKLPPVEPKKIPDIVKFEAVQQIPFPIEEVEWDYQTFQDEDSPEVEVGIFAITKDRLLPWLSNFQLIDLPVHAVALSPVAAFNALNYDLDLGERTDGTIIMDIGTSATDLIVTENGRIWLRTIPIGGNHFTEALVKNFKLSFSKAEKLKREAATSKYARQIFTTMRPVFVDLVQEVQKSLGYYQSLNRDAELGQLIGLGQTFRLPGLQTFLKQQLQVDVTRLDNYKKIEVEGRDAAKFADSALSLAPAYGLALQGLDLNKVNCNLLPAPVVREQLWKSKQPQFIAAAAIAVVAAGLAYGGLVVEKGRFDSDASEQARDQADQIIEEAQEYRSAWDQANRVGDPLQRTENIHTLTEHRDVAREVFNLQQEILMSVDPQPEILNGDTVALEALPREELRYLVFTEVRTEYLAPTSQEVDWTENPPGYRIQISGFTPHAGADLFIADRVMDFLTSIRDDPQRPYRLVVNPGNRNVQRINEPDDGRTGGAGRRDGRTREADQPQAEPLVDSPFDRPQPGDSEFQFSFDLLLRPPDYEPPAPDAGEQPTNGEAEAGLE